MSLQSHPILLGALLTCLTVPAAEAAERKPAARIAFDRCAKVEPLPGTPEMPGAYLFGFTDSTDPGDPCTWGFASENDARFGKRDGRYFALSSKSELTYTYSRNVALSVSAFTAYHRWSDVSAIQDTLASEGEGVFADSLRRASFDGVSGELFVRVLARSPGQPVAATLAVEPRWSRVDNITGYRAEGYGAEFKLLVDAVLAERLYAAVNFNYGLGTQRFDIPGAEWARASIANASAAVTAQIYAGKQQQWLQGLFLGIEARHKSAFDGLGLDTQVGRAFFLGPTLTLNLPGDRSLSLAWTPQLAGRARDAASPGSLDLDNYERHELRVKFAMPLELPSSMLSAFGKDHAQTRR
jgi:hypothetical protein